jgi:hypothetical protein
MARMMDLPSLNIRGMTPKSILPVQVGKRKIPAKAILKAMIWNFFHSLLLVMKSLTSSARKSFQEKYFVSKPRKYWLSAKSHPLD